MTTRPIEPIVWLAALVFGLVDQRPTHGQVIPLANGARSRVETGMLRALNTPLNARFSETPLTDVLVFIGRVGNTQVQIDVKALEDAGFDMNTPVTKVFEGISVRSALTLLLQPLNLAWIVVEESLVITTKEHADSELRTVVYPVRDLITSRRGLLLLSECDSLIDVITTSIAPTTWDEVGGPGSIAEVRITKSLVVSQTREIHERIEALLAALRKSVDVQGIVLVYPHPPAGSAAEPDETFRERPRYTVRSSAAWQLPRTHESSR